ncbi:hypothetical protein PPTG_23724 [Phytophthora nicotianae INRA-310]|uniref:Uncharacterized protein n=1 Tax=Phytophthora nicotianae (strain INRA-310) TaxID=761204 RepID=W2PUP2_PHYN3|nr:hypothetical protein PPTG_23724 [Phytophthora nicotianae INRA-310]ETN03934.1 hypothetical protein PPTG_23724 [Phytophthora nicotianae INRA-310]
MRGRVQQTQRARGRRECSEATEAPVISFNRERYVSLTAETRDRDPDSRVFPAIDQLNRYAEVGELRK